jgi:hypothetical protein
MSSAPARDCQFAVAPRHHHHLGASQRQQPRDLTADPGRSAGDQRNLAEVQPGDILAEAGHRLARPRGLADAGGKI